MIKRTLFTLIAFLGFTITAFAHSATDKSLPENGATLNTAPEAISMTFVKPVRITKAGMIYNDKHVTKFKIPSKSFVNNVKFTPSFNGNGVYVVEWRGLSKDGHVAKGRFSFKVNAE